MTHWVRAVEKKWENGDRGGKASGRTRKEAAKNRVGRNDRLSLGSGGEAEKREVKTSTEAARD